MVNLIKLTNGTEIVGKIVNETESSIKVNNPLQINYYQTPKQTMPMVALQRYMPFSAEEETTFKKEHVMAVTVPVKGMDEYYSKMLHNIKLNIDPSITADLQTASDTMAEGADEERDMYLAILERMALKRPLN